MAARLSVGRVDLGLTAQLRTVYFPVLTDPWKAVQELLPAVAPFGVRVGDFRIPERRTQDSPLSFYTSVFNARLYPERVELWGFELQRGVFEAQWGLFEALLRTVCPTGEMGLCSVVLGVHGTVEGTSPGEFLERFVQDSPSGLGPAGGHAVSFRFGPEAARVFSTLTLDASTVVEGGVWLRLDSGWEVQVVPVEELLAHVVDYGREALTALGLEVPNEEGER